MVETLGQNVVGKPIHVDDCCRDPPSPAICNKVQAWVKEDLMAVVSEESGGSRQQPPIRGRSGVINVTDRSQGAYKRHYPKNHRNGCSDERHVIIQRVHGLEGHDLKIKLCAAAAWWGHNDAEGNVDGDWVDEDLN
jgi:hypothetical protein